MKIRSSRRRVRQAEPPPTETSEPMWGARSPGVRARRLHEPPRELDVGDRIRRTLEARRGASSGPTFWRG